MTVLWTKAIEGQLAPLSGGIVLFAEKFEEWKRLGEYQSFFFGKDGAYTGIKVGVDDYKLFHVHLPPIKDAKALADWQAEWKKKGRKTSNTVLVYTHDDKGNYLLIFIVREPHGHDFGEQTTPAHAKNMAYCVKIAEAFRFNGAIIA